MAASKLQQQLRNSLGWDDDVLQDVVQSITQAGSRAEVEELAQNFMEGNETALKAVRAYTAERFQPLGPARQTASQKQAQNLLVVSTPSPPASQKQQQQGASAGDGTVGGAGGGWRHAPAAPTNTVSTAVPAVPITSDADGKVFGIFKQGGRVKAPAGKSPGGKDKEGKKEAKSPATTLAASVERSVVNCLGCGKIYHTRNTTNPDVVKFLERKGLCTFCGTQVSLTYRRTAASSNTQSNNAAQPITTAEAVPDVTAGDSAPQPNQPPSMADRLKAPKGSQGPDEDAVKAAIAFKDRLVMYDRESAKRTNVIDDQSDFFEVDTNAWLTDEERQQIRERRRVEAAAEAARKSRVAITIDLLGRRVLAADPNEALSEGVSFRTNDDTLAPAFDPKARNANAAMWAAPAKGTDASTQETGLAVQKRPETALQPSVVQSASEVAQSAEARVRLAAQQLKSLRVTAAPQVAGSREAPQFVHASDSRHQAGAAGKGQVARQQHTQGLAKGRAGGHQTVPRLQHDIAEVFEDFNTEVLFLDLEQALEVSEPPFDLCPPDMRHLPPLPPPASLPSVQNEVHELRDLPPGVALLRGWLTPYMQTQLVNNLRQLGISPGGFYQPSYGTQAGQMHLRMMCLGMHWEPRQHTYMSARPKDGAVPPPLPPYFKHLCNLALKDATQMVQKLHGVQLPGMTPDICIINHYDHHGKLGMHQDKDESSESLRAGLPVVSFSLGDAADFIFSSFHDVDGAQGVRLMSGDVLVFGGPARLLYHAVTAVHTGTSPTELVQSTGLRPGRLNLTFRHL